MAASMDRAEIEAEVMRLEDQLYQVADAKCDAVERRASGAEIQALQREIVRLDVRIKALRHEQRESLR